MSLSNKAVKQLNKALKAHSASIVAVATQGNGHNAVTVAVKGSADVLVRGVPSTPRDINHTANHLRQSVGRALAAKATTVAFS